MTEQPEPAKQIESREQRVSTDVNVLSQMISALRELSQEDRKRIIDTVVTFFGIEPPKLAVPNAEGLESPSSAAGKIGVGFSEDLSMSPKEFLLEKNPHTDVARVACLAYYLTHYGNTPHFKTLDISKLNTEAAQRKFTNAAYATDNAVKQGYLVEATRGQRQLSAFGEQYVRRLPDRQAARILMAETRARRRVRRKTKGTPESD
jgi:hypothetical protein